jgi:hypothetical protein
MLNGRSLVKMFGRFAQDRGSGGGEQVALTVDEGVGARPTSSPRSSSRRSILKGGMFGLAGIVGWGAAAASSRGPAMEASGVGAAGAAAAGALGAMTLGGSGFTFGGDGAAETHGELLGPGGASLGSFSSTPLGGTAGDAATGTQFQTFKLSDGSIFGIGAAPPGDGPAMTFAIVGGTGKYAGATGSYLADVRPADAGGDGSAQFDFTFTH